VTELIKVWSHNEVLAWVRSKTASGRFKRCVHLHVIPITEETEYSNADLFIPKCARRSFDWKTECYGRKEDELHVLTTFLHTDPISCPKKCLNYQNKRWAQFRLKLSRTATAVGHASAAPFRWFKELPAPQVWVLFALVVLGICLLVPRLVPLITQLLNASHGH
jgi:hypothetical protein